MRKFQKSSRAGWHVAIVVARFNEHITSSLLQCCQKELIKQGLKNVNLKIVWIPGAFELPFAAQKLALTQQFDAVICLGCVIKGETSHDRHVASWARQGIGQVSLSTGVPTLFGVLTPRNEAQAKRRSRPGPLNRGLEIAKAAIEMIEFAQNMEI